MSEIPFICLSFSLVFPPLLLGEVLDLDNGTRSRRGLLPAQREGNEGRKGKEGGPFGLKQTHFSTLVFHLTKRLLPRLAPLRRGREIKKGKKTAQYLFFSSFCLLLSTFVEGV